MPDSWPHALKMYFVRFSTPPHCLEVSVGDGGGLRSEGGKEIEIANFHMELDLRQRDRQRDRASSEVLAYVKPSIGPILASRYLDPRP